MRKQRNYLSIDLEDWYHGLETFGITDKSMKQSRIVVETCKILDILAQYGVHATFFVLGCVASKYPELIKTIAAAGHEIASHGYNHKLIYQQNKEDFLEEVKNSVDLLSGLASKDIIGFRAPMFSIKEENLWALDVLSDVGLKYDSSIYPFQTKEFGIKNSQTKPYIVKINQKSVIEFPLSTIKIMGQNIPFAGGFFLRTLPYGMIKSAINQINNKNNPVIVYFHPFDLDNDIPKLKNIKLKHRIVHYHNIQTVEKKIKKLLYDFEFISFREGLNNVESNLRLHE